VEAQARRKVNIQGNPEAVEPVALFTTTPPQGKRELELVMIFATSVNFSCLLERGMPT
jgi:hypothetical protein